MSPKGPIVSHVKSESKTLTFLHKMLAVTSANLAADFADEYGVVHVFEAGVVEYEVRVGPSIIVIVGTRRHPDFSLNSLNTNVCQHHARDETSQES